MLSTCPFDAVIELLATTYADSATYKKIIDENYNDLIFFQILVNYVTNGPNNVFYLERTSYLLTLFDKKENVVNCACNVTNLLTKLLTGAPSFEEKSICLECCHEERKNISVAQLNSKPILQQGLYTGLQISVNMLLDKSKSTDVCKKCGIKVFCERIPHVHFFIDVEHAYHSTILDKTGFSESPKNVTLSEIPTHLYIKDEKYRLIGVISYNGHAEQEIGHFIAYCQKITGIWEEYDSLKNKCIKLHSLNTFVKPSMIGYVKLTD